MTEISDGQNTVIPTVIVATSHGYRSQNRTHELMSGRIAATLGGTSPRRGTLGLLMKGEVAKQAVVDMHRNGKVFQMESHEQPTLTMTYVLDEDGQIEVEQLTDYKDLWMVRIDYQEVTE